MFGVGKESQKVIKPQETGKSPENVEIPEGLKAFATMMLGTLALGVAAETGKKVWEAKGDKIKKGLSDLGDQAIEGCLSRAKEELNRVLEINNHDLKEQAKNRPEVRKQEGNTAQVPKQEPVAKERTTKKEQFDVVNAEIIDEQDTESQQESESGDEGETTIEYLLKKDPKFAEAFSRFDKEDMDERNAFVDSLPEKKQTEYILMMIGVSSFTEKLNNAHGEGAEETNKKKVVVESGETVSVEQYEVMKQQYLKAEREKRAVTDFLLKHILQV
jgi:hypothetical protein